MLINSNAPGYKPAQSKVSKTFNLLGIDELVFFFFSVNTVLLPLKVEVDIMTQTQTKHIAENPDSNELG